MHREITQQQRSVYLLSTQFHWRPTSTFQARTHTRTHARSHNTHTHTHFDTRRRADSWKWVPSPSNNRPGKSYDWNVDGYILYKYKSMPGKYEHSCSKNTAPSNGPHTRNDDFIERFIIFWLHTAKLQTLFPDINHHWWYLQENDNRRHRDRKVNVNFVKIGFTGQTDCVSCSYPASFSCLVLHNSSRFHAQCLCGDLVICCISVPPKNHYLGWIICLSTIAII